MNRTCGAYTFGPFVLNIAERLLLREGKEVPLTPKAFDTLRTLVLRTGRAVSKQELLDAVWPDISVEENNLSQNISLLRKLLNQGDDVEYIVTIPKHGYRFAADVVEAAPKVTRPVLDIARPPETHYARSGDLKIAYQVVGDGPIDLVFVMGWVSHLEYFWKEPSFARFLRRLSSFSRLILFDKRGTGLSDRVPVSQLPTLEERMDDVHAVLNAVQSSRAVICGVSEGGPMSAIFAATYPEMSLALVMIGTYARRICDEAYPWGQTIEQHHALLSDIENSWGGPIGLEERAPSVASDPMFRDWWATYLRMSASPGAAIAMTKMNAQIDVRSLLPSVRIPTLVLHRTGDRCLHVEEGRYVASRIPGARFVELPGEDHLPFVGDQDAMLNEIERFVTALQEHSERDRVLATVLFLTKRSHVASETWSRFESLALREVEWFSGRRLRSVDTALAATFDGPARALRCACSLADHAGRLQLRIGIGLHTGECDLLPDGEFGGIAVDITSQVARHAGAGEILVSSTVRDLVAGSPFRFDYRDKLSLRADVGEFRLFQVRGANAEAAQNVRS